MKSRGAALLVFSIAVIACLLCAQTIEGADSASPASAQATVSSTPAPSTAGQPDAGLGAQVQNQWSDEQKKKEDEKKEEEKKEKEEKQRVPKGKEKEAAPSEEDKKSEEGGGFFSDCLGTIFSDCLTDAVASIVCNPFSGGKEKEAGPEYVSGEMHRVELPPEAIGPVSYEGSVDPLTRDAKFLVVWSVAGAVESGGHPVGELQRGAEVEAVERSLRDGVPWVKVRDVQGTCPTGWVLEEDISATETLYVRKTLSTPRHAITWQLFSNHSWELFGGKEIAEEYRSGGYRIGGEAKLFLTDVVAIGLGVGYCQANGEPKYDYVTSAQIDYPLDSDLSILDMGIQLGFSLPFGGGDGYFCGGIGPSAYRVRERARIRFVQLEGDTVVNAGSRADELERWRPGVDVNFGAGWTLGGHVPIGLYTRFFWIPWKSQKNESLTLDWLDQSSIVGFNVGISIGYAAR